MNNRKTLKNPIFFIASLGGIGLIRFAPGTFGSIFAWFLIYFLISLPKYDPLYHFGILVSDLGL